MTDTVDISRLRPPEIASGFSGLMLLAWRGRRDRPVMRWLSLPTGISALALTYTQATRRAPALPVALSVVVTAFGAVTTVGLLGRVLRRKGSAAAWPGLIAAMGVLGSGFLSMRQESGTDPATLGSLETITLD